MKAAVFNGKGKLDIENVEIPKPGCGEILVKVAFCGVCGTDVHIFEGAEGAAQTVAPTILGHEFSGVVYEVGEGVTELKIGDRIAVDPNNTCGECYYCRSGLAHFCENMVAYGTIQNGGFAEYCVVNQKVAYKLPDDMSLAHGAMAEPLACCLHGIDECNIKTGSTVLIIGAGPIGLLMLQLAKISGAARVVVLEPIEEKRKIAKNLGADIVINPVNINLQQELEKNSIPRLEVVIDCVGLPSTMLQAINAAGKKSTVMLFGLGKPSDTIALQPFTLFKKEITLKSSFINPYTIGRAVSLIVSKKIMLDEIIVNIIGLEELAETLKDPKKRALGKVIVDPSRAAAVNGG